MRRQPARPARLEQDALVALEQPNLRRRRPRLPAEVLQTGSDHEARPWHVDRHVLPGVEGDVGVELVVLGRLLDELWDRERGLDDRQYIVPGGGGFGELMNNAYV